MTNRLMPYCLCNGNSAKTICIVLQLGFAIILSEADSWSAFISGTINFLVVSIRHADELSITVVPTAANFGAHSLEVFPPAESIAMSGCAATASANPIIL